ncbi:hypothetical protein HUS23_08070 [Ectothiorhodospiraceae bacterium 2226]|nr:hypothetical protein HUS23_08070 [Ectothiorhodospiraceae bacterium 2226]
METFVRWWGDFELRPGEVGHWRLSDTHIWIEHLTHEWRIGVREGKNPRDTTVEVHIPAAEPFPDEDVTVTRYALAAMGSGLRLLPMLADRSVVTRPETAFQILPGEEVTLYLSTPLWVRIELAAGNRLLQEVPVYTPSDTWFGSSTIEGELCYASRTHCRQDLAAVERRPHRVITAVALGNGAADALWLERLNLPVPNLSIYSDDHGHLWTQGVTLERKPGMEMAALRLEAAPPSAAKRATLVNGPRQASNRSFMTRAFSALFS